MTTASGTVVPVTATIDNYATASIVQSSGPGTLVQSGSVYTIDLGVVAAGSADIVEALAVKNSAVGPADWLSGSLSASLAPGFTDTGLGAFGTLSAGGSTAFSVDLSTANAGVITQTITLAASGSNASGYNGVLQSETVVVVGTVVAAGQLAVPQINEPSPIVLADAHVAALVANDQTTLDIGNTGSAALSAAVLSATGAAYGSGAFSGLAPGLSDTTSIVAGLNNTTAGAKSGTVTLSFGSGTGTGTPVPLSPQTVALSGNVYREAAASITAPVNLYVHVGDGGGTASAALIASNTDVADNFSEALDATILGVVSGGLSGASGTATGIAAQGSNETALQITFSTATATTINASVAVQETSDGSGIDSLGLTQLGTVDVPVTVTVDNYATAAIEQTGGPGTVSHAGSVYTLNLGTLIAGQGDVTADFGLFNIAGGPADWLTGSLLAAGSTAFANTGLGSIGTLGAGGGDPFTVALSTSNTGIFSETIVFAGTDANPSGFSAAVSGETLVVSGTVQAPALPRVNTTSPVDFGNVRQATTTEHALSISNTASAGGAFLDVFTGGQSGAATDGGVILLLAPGATDTTGVEVGLNTGTAGVQTGSAYLNFEADPGRAAGRISLVPPPSALPARSIARRRPR